MYRAKASRDGLIPSPRDHRYSPPMSATSQQELPFTRLGEYEVLAPISEGGMATIYLGRKAGAGSEHFALKVIRPEHERNLEFIAMFLDEARIALTLVHPNIVAMHGVGHDGTRHFLVMELMRGRSLVRLWEAARAKQTRLSYEVVAWIGARVADALHFAHERKDERGASQQIVHRDVSPENIFVTYDGVPKVLDFGLAKARDRLASTAAGMVKGKLAYLSPEQAHGEAADRRADVFALGVTLWELATNRRLFKQDSDVETVRRVRAAEVPDPTSIVDGFPRELADVLKRALARDKGERYATAKELADALDACAGATKVETVRDVVAGLLANQRAPEWEALLRGPTMERGRVEAPPPPVDSGEKLRA
jgi:serine/threonine-protein kinase